jgi:hypothetical protein
MNKRSLVTGLAIILLSNAIALGGVAYNRSGQPTSQLTLTERELRLPYSYGFQKENSGVSVSLGWRVFDLKNTQTWGGVWQQVPWFDQQKLAAMGFDVSYPLDKPDSFEHYRRVISREVFLVLEYDGETYQKVLQQRRDKVAKEEELQRQNPDKKEFERRVKNARRALEFEATGNSRLFVIDAGLDADALRNLYRDSGKFLIARGQVSMYYSGNYKLSPHLFGVISRLSVQQISVPLAYASLLKQILGKHASKIPGKPPRYAVSLKYGQRYEPWVTGVQKISSP